MGQLDADTLTFWRMADRLFSHHGGRGATSTVVSRMEFGRSGSLSTWTSHAHTLLHLFKLL